MNAARLAVSHWREWSLRTRYKRLKYLQLPVGKQQIRDSITLEQHVNGSRPSFSSLLPDRQLHTTNPNSINNIQSPRSSMEDAAAVSVGQLSLTNLFRSARLIYRATEDTTEDKALYRQIIGDAETLAQSTHRLLRPIPAEENDKDFEGLCKAALSVVICLPADKAADADAKPTPVGLIVVELRPNTKHHRSCELAIMLSPEHRGKGYGSKRRHHRDAARDSPLT